MKKRSRKSCLREVGSSTTVTVGSVVVDVAAEFRELLVKGGVAIAGALPSLPM